MKEYNCYVCEKFLDKNEINVIEFRDGTKFLCDKCYKATKSLFECIDKSIKNRKGKYDNS